MFDWWSIDLYLPQLLGAGVTGVLTGVVAAGVAWWTARHEVRQAETRRSLEQAERDSQDAALRQDTLNRQVVSELTNTMTKLLAAIQRRDDVAAADAVLWAESRTVQMKVLLHSRGRADLLEWFGQEWGGTLSRFHELMLPNPQLGRWEVHVPEDEQWEVEAELVSLECVFARWSTQPVEEWSAEKPPPELLTAFPEDIPSLPQEQDG
jgi:hypothetical protein